MSQLRLKYGSYTHPDSEAAVSISKEGLLNDEGEIWAIRQVWDISGRLESDTQAGLTTQIKNLEAAYASKVSRVALEFANTGAATAHVLDDSNTVSGIQVTVPPSYPNPLGAEYSTFRNYFIQIEAVVQTGSLLSGGVINWEETIAVSGGFPIDVLVTTINTLPIRQRVAQASPTFVNQSGQCSAYGGWPVPPAFILDTTSVATLVAKDVAKTTAGIRIEGTSGKVTVYTTTWNYTFGLQAQNVSLPGRLRPAVIPVSLS
jgi:hypothetical protein